MAYPDAVSDAFRGLALTVAVTQEVLAREVAGEREIPGLSFERDHIQAMPEQFLDLARRLRRQPTPVHRAVARCALMVARLARVLLRHEATRPRDPRGAPARGEGGGGVLPGAPHLSREAPENRRAGASSRASEHNWQGRMRFS